MTVLENRLITLALALDQAYDEYAFTKETFDQARNDILQFASTREGCSYFGIAAEHTNVKACREINPQARTSLIFRERSSGLDIVHRLTIAKGPLRSVEKGLPRLTGQPVEPPAFECVLPVTLKTSDLVEIPRSERHRWLEYIVYTSYLAGFGGREELLPNPLTLAGPPLRNLRLKTSRRRRPHASRGRRTIPTSMCSISPRSDTRTFQPA